MPDPAHTPGAAPRPGPTARSDADVLVVGLGPAGAAAATEAATAGASVVAIERKAQIGVPVQCAELVPGPLAREARGSVVQRVQHMRTRLPSGHVHHAAGPGLMIDRARFDQGLARAAAAAGAHLWTDTLLLALDPRENTVVVRRAGVCTTLRCGIVVAADGPHSAVARLLGMPALDVAQAWQVTVPLAAADDATAIALSAACPGGYAWCFPRGAVANVGVGMVRRYGGPGRRHLQDWHRELVAEGRVHATVLGRTGGGLPVAGLREPLVQGRVMFAGDAAGATHPITGAGIAPAVLTGRLAGAAAAAAADGRGPGVLDQYAEQVYELYGPSVARALRRRRELEPVWCQRMPAEDRALRRGWIAFNEYYD